MSEPPLTGTVLAVQANFYRVQLESLRSQPVPELLCTRRARLKKLGQRVMVGDRVWIEEPDWQGQRGAIAAVQERHSELQRPPIANADQALLLFSLTDPPLDPYQLSRFLVAIESTQLKVLLCLSKADLVSAQAQQDWCHQLQAWGYPPLVISSYSGLGIEALQQQLKGQITVLAGPSGVGKSSLINRLIPDVELRVGEVSERWRRGKHTTRHVELFELPAGGLMADTPGFTQPSLSCVPEELIQCFPEVRDRLATGPCQFKDCLHRDEPECGIRGEWERYAHYLDFLAEVIAQQEQELRSRNPESATKAKAGQSGSVQHEPKLETKRYRRQSRRAQRQDLEQLYDEAQEATYR